MFGRDTKSDVKVDTLIHRSVHVHGDLEFAGGLHIDGHIAGNVKADPDRRSLVSMSETGRVDGSLEASSVIVNGTVLGNIRATGRVVLGPGARVRGNINYGVIEMSLGAEISGALVRIPSPAVGEPGAAPSGEESARGQSARNSRHAPAAISSTPVPRS